MLNLKSVVVPQSHILPRLNDNCSFCLIFLMRHRITELLPESRILVFNEQMHAQVALQLFVHVVGFADVSVSDDNNSVPVFVGRLGLSGSEFMTAPVRVKKVGGDENNRTSRLFN